MKEFFRKYKSCRYSGMVNCQAGRAEWKPRERMERCRQRTGS